MRSASRSASRSAPPAGAADEPAAATAEAAAATEPADRAGAVLRAAVAVRARAVARHDADRHDHLVTLVESQGDLGGAVALQAGLHGADLVLPVDPDGHR